MIKVKASLLCIAVLMVSIGVTSASTGTHSADDSSASALADGVEKTGGLVLAPIDAVTDQTDKILKVGLKAADAVVLKPVEKLKDETNELLPDEVTLVSSEDLKVTKDTNAMEKEKDVGPKLKMTF